MLVRETDTLNKIDAIKLVRKVTGLGLMEAKNVVEQVNSNPTLEELGDFLAQMRVNDVIMVDNQFYAKIK